MVFRFVLSSSQIIDKVLQGALGALQSNPGGKTTWVAPPRNSKSPP